MKAERTIVALALVLVAACSTTSPGSMDADSGHTGGSMGASGSGADAGSTGGATNGGTSSGSSDGGSNSTGASTGGSSGGSNGTTTGGSTGGSGALVLPPVNEGLDYQLGGAYAPPAAVKIVSRDRTAAIAKGLYNICYVNGFQIQPGEEATWMKDHPNLILRDQNQAPVIDKDWNEILIDVSTAQKRSELAEVIGGFIAGCKTSGFDAIEIDNLDSFSRSGGLLKEADAIATIALFSAKAHALGLPIAQKNSAELVEQKSAMGTDFVVAEECNQYDECDVYTKAYGDHVLVIEYEEDAFKRGCTAFPNLSMVLRDRDLVAPNDTGYVFDGC